MGAWALQLYEKVFQQWKELIHDWCHMSKRPLHLNCSLETGWWMKSSIQGWFFRMNTQAEWDKVAAEKVILISFLSPLIHCLPSFRITLHRLACYVLIFSPSPLSPFDDWQIDRLLKTGLGRNWLPLHPLYLGWQFEAAHEKNKSSSPPPPITTTTT